MQIKTCFGTLSMVSLAILSQVFPFLVARAESSSPQPPYALNCEMTYIEGWDKPRLPGKTFAHAFGNEGFWALPFSDGTTHGFIFVFEADDASGQKQFGFSTVTGSQPTWEDAGQIILGNGNAMFPGSLSAGIDPLLAAVSEVRWQVFTNQPFEFEGKKTIGSYLTCRVTKSSE